MWTRQFGAAFDDGVSGIAVDSVGAVYLTGTTITDTGHSFAFVRKLDTNGDVLWTQQFAAGAADAIDVDDGGQNLYIVGAAGEIPGQAGAGESDAVVRKLDAGGNEVWTRLFGTPAAEGANGVAVDATGGVYVSGIINSWFFLPDAFVRKFDAAGNELWSRQFGSLVPDEEPASDSVNGLAVIRPGVFTWPARRAALSWDSPLRVERMPSSASTTQPVTRCGPANSAQSASMGLPTWPSTHTAASMWRGTPREPSPGRQAGRVRPLHPQVRRHRQRSVDPPIRDAEPRRCRGGD